MERIKLAEKIISTCREMNASGLNQGTSGNVSARYTGGMLITPSGIAYSKMTPDMIVFVDDKGNHGMLAMDVTLEKTLWLAGETETLADLYIKCGGLHHDVPVLSEAEMTIVLEKFKTYGLKA